MVSRIQTRCMGILFAEIYGKLSKIVPKIRNNGSKSKELSRTPTISIIDHLRFFVMHISMSILSAKGLENKEKLTILQPIEYTKQ